MEARETRILLSAAAFAASSPAAKATVYASLAALAALTDAVLVRFEGGGDSRYRRGTFWPIGEGTADQTWRVDVYAVLEAEHGASGKVSLQYLGQASGTIGADTVVGYDIGVEEAWAKTAAFASSGFAEALSGGELQVLPFPPTGNAIAGGPAGFAISDIGPAVALLLVPAKGASTPVTGVRVFGQRWR